MIAPNGSNVVGNPHTFTATVYLNDGDGTGFHAVGAGVAVTLTLTSSNGASITPITPAAASSVSGNVDTFNLTTNANGQASVTFTSPTAGQVVGSASATLSIPGGGSVTRTTGDTDPLDGPSATKYFLSLTTNPGGSVVIGGGTPLSDSATLAGGDNPGGTITFYLMAPGSTSGTPLSSAVYTDAVNVSGDNTYSTSSGTSTGTPCRRRRARTSGWRSTAATPTTPRTPAAFGNEPETVSPAAPTINTTPGMIPGSSGGVVAGEFATIGFWHNQNGQAVINSFNGSSSSKLLGNWLASNYPNLFGASNPYTGTSLAGLTNAQVATVYLNLWTPSGLVKNTYVQAFAVALGVYADTTSLGGQSLVNNGLAAKYGFVVSAGGGDNATYNVGSDGAAFGVANGTTLSVSQDPHDGEQQLLAFDRPLLRRRPDKDERLQRRPQRRQLQRRHPGQRRRLDQRPERADRLGHALGRLQPDRHDHVLPARSRRHCQHAPDQRGLHRYRHGQPRQRHLRHEPPEPPRATTCRRKRARTSGSWSTPAAATATTMG